jgi:hypothetical protein
MLNRRKMHQKTLARVTACIFDINQLAPLVCAVAGDFDYREHVEEAPAQQRAARPEARIIERFR